MCTKVDVKSSVVVMISTLVINSIYAVSAAQPRHAEGINVQMERLVKDYSKSI